MTLRSSARPKIAVFVGPPCDTRVKAPVMVQLAVNGEYVYAFIPTAGAPRPAVGMESGSNLPSERRLAVRRRALTMFGPNTYVSPNVNNWPSPRLAVLMLNGL